MLADMFSHVSYATPATITAVGVILPALAIFAVTLRFYSRFLHKTELLMDDWLTLPALALNIGIGAAMIAGAQGGGLGYMTPYPHTTDLETIEEYTSHPSTLSQQVEAAVQLMQILALGFTKLSVLYFYRRIFCSSSSSPFSWATNTMIGLTIAWSLAFFFAFLFQCGTSFYAAWGNIKDLITLCDQSFKAENGLAISDVFFDLLILMLPIPQIWRLHLSLRRKIAVTGVFLLGALALAASIMRMAIFIIAVEVGFQRAVDPDVEIAEALYWTTIESGLALVAACLPSLRFLFEKLSPDVLLNRLQNVISLSSLRSQRSRSSQHVGSTEQYSTSTSSHAQFGKTVGSGVVETYVMKDRRDQRDLEAKGSMPLQEIMVQTDISQSEGTI